ncbi:MAG: matrixin family metalloprotease [Bryobacteraceae bacterium]
MQSQSFRWILFVALAQGLVAQDAIRLKTRTLGREPTGRQLVPGSRLPATAGHYILQFQHLPDFEGRQQLARRGARVLEYVPDNALMVSIPAGFEGADLGVARWLRMAAADKISPLADAGNGFYLAVFQPDTNMNDAQALVESYGFQILQNAALLPAQLLIGGDSGQLANLAAWDEVSYIMPASADLVSGAPVMACAGALTEAGPVGNYVLVSQGWPVDSTGVVSLNYVFGALTNQLDTATVESQIESAFRAWEQYANISLTPGAQADAVRTIFVEFVSGAHGDAYPFTDPSSLAHTFYPDPPNSEPIAGDMHLNADETWNVGSSVDVFSVALHEAGHALGLGHSDQPGAVMYPYYHRATGLTDYDIAGIQALYGTPGSQPAPPSNPPASNPPASNPPAPNPPAPNPPSSPPAPNPPSSNPPSSGGGSTPPSLTITSPAGTMVSTTAASLLFSGTAAASAGVASVKWNDAFGDTGVAAGTSSWSVSIPLLVGTNAITVRAYDAAGNSAWRSVTVVRD